MSEKERQSVSKEIVKLGEVPLENETKKRKNFSSRTADRIKTRLSKSPKRRAATPEPDQRTCTDESEKDVSDGENLFKKHQATSAGTEERIGKDGTAAKRFISRKSKQDIGRSKSLERNVKKEPDSEDDFEIIRRMHQSKALEDEIKEQEKLIIDSKVKTKEKLKEFVPKEMPPLIVTPKDVKKRKRHKSLPLQEFQSDDEKPKALVEKLKPKLMKRKTSTSEEEDLSVSLNGSATESSELRYRKSEIMKKRANEDLPQTESKSNEKNQKEEKRWFLSRWFSKSTKSENKENNKLRTTPDTQKLKMAKTEKNEKTDQEKSKRWLVSEIYHEWKDHVSEHKEYYKSCKNLKNRCLTDLIMLLIFCGFGGLIFRFTEGAFETFYKCGVKRVKRDFIDNLWKHSQYMLEEDWKSQARRKLMEFENQLHSAHEAGMTTYSGQKSWSFLNAVVYCLTVVTTIGIVLQQ